MKKNLLPNVLSCLSLFTGLCLPQHFCAQQQQQQPKNEALVHCTTDEAMKAYYASNPDALKQAQEFEAYTRQFTENFSQQKNAQLNCYVIPVVFHVYGTTQNGYSVNLSIIQGALNNWVNKDFHGTNSDYSTVHSSFQSVKSSMPDVTFALAQIDPNGNPTTGVVNHPVAAGFGNGSGYNSAIAADAWDNYKYMNVYVMADLYNDGDYYNSGVAWYPDVTMSNANTARVVYNGAYLGSNCNSWQPEFASVLTHEFGHWLNLAHTFDGGCTSPNDNVSDTPMCDYNTQAYTCHSSSTSSAPTNCNGQLINAENYMDYSGADGCYKMFTAGQVTRVYAALMHPARQPLWQQSNLVATGLGNLCSTASAAQDEFAPLYVGAFPNPANDKFTVGINVKKENSFDVEITDLTGRLVYSNRYNVIAGDNRLEIDLSAQSSGVYQVKISNAGFSKTVKLLKQ